MKYGWKRDLPDHRDRIFNNASVVLAAHQVPTQVDLSAKMPPIYDQGQLGSCTANGWARIMEMREMAQGKPASTPSRLFIYYNERLIEGDIGQDNGAQVRTGAQVVASIGAPPETDWAYDIDKFAERPPAQAFTDAKKEEALTYQRIVIGGPGAPMRTAVANGLPIVFGFSVPDFFEQGWDTTTPLPLPGGQTQIIGGHCVVITGYDWTCTHFPVPAFQCDNSWGPAWGIGGRFWMDYRWFDPNPGLAQDLWVVQSVN